MSMIGAFGLCAEEKYSALAAAAGKGETERAGELIQELCGEWQASAPQMKNDLCAGEAFIALFHYLKAAFGLDLRQEAGPQGAEALWRSQTGDLDIIAFSERNRAQILSLAERTNQAELDRFVCDFFESDYGDAGWLAWDVLLSNLRRLKNGETLVWRLY